jgi:hypothetical protein
MQVAVMRPTPGFELLIIMPPVSSERCLMFSFRDNPVQTYRPDCNRRKYDFVL